MPSVFNMKKWTLYRHTSPSGKVYIGITTQMPHIRWEYGNGYKACKLFHNTILKYGWNNIKHEILFTNLEECRAKALEIDLIRHYKNLGISLNIVNGGNGTLGMVWTDSMKLKLRLSKLGKKCSEETKNKMKNSRKGTHAGKDNPMYGKKHSEESKLKMSISRSGKNNWKYGTHLTEEEKYNSMKAQKSSKAVLQFDLFGNFLKEFYSQGEAAKYVGCNPSNISECCRGKRKQVKGFKWEYKNG